MDLGFCRGCSYRGPLFLWIYNLATNYLHLYLNPVIFYPMHCSSHFLFYLSCCSHLVSKGVATIQSLFYLFYLQHWDLWLFYGSLVSIGPLSIALAIFGAAGVGFQFISFTNHHISISSIRVGFVPRNRFIGGPFSFSFVGFSLFSWGGFLVWEACFAIVFFFCQSFYWFFVCRSFIFVALDLFIVQLLISTRSL